ncbi:hypothetical protein TrRE_jg4233, partial [Triparma retinervis]
MMLLKTAAKVVYITAWLTTSSAASSSLAIASSRILWEEARVDRIRFRRFVHTLFIVSNSSVGVRERAVVEKPSSVDVGPSDRESEGGSRQENRWMDNRGGEDGGDQTEKGGGRGRVEEETSEDEEEQDEVDEDDEDDEGEDDDEDERDRVVSTGISSQVGGGGFPVPAVSIPHPSTYVNGVGVGSNNGVAYSPTTDPTYHRHEEQVRSMRSMRAAVALQNLRLENEVMQLQRELELLNSVEHNQPYMMGPQGGYGNGMQHQQAGYGYGGGYGYGNQGMQQHLPMQQQQYGYYNNNGGGGGGG